RTCGTGRTDVYVVSSTRQTVEGNRRCAVVLIEVFSRSVELICTQRNLECARISNCHCNGAAESVVITRRIRWRDRMIHDPGECHRNCERARTARGIGKGDRIVAATQIVKRTVAKGAAG